MFCLVPPQPTSTVNSLRKPICIKLTIITDACRSPLFSSCNAFTRSLYVSSSTFSTLFCCCNDSIRFWSCSRVTGDGGIIIGPPSIELESLSLALSAMFLQLHNVCPGQIIYNLLHITLYLQFGRIILDLIYKIYPHVTPFNRRNSFLLQTDPDTFGFLQTLFR
jgi:hypothetical protein